MAGGGCRRWWNFGVASLFLAAFLACQVDRAWGDAIGSPSGILEKGQWVLGLRGRGLFKRKMNGNADASAYQGTHFRGYGLTDWLSLYGGIGAGELVINDPSAPRTGGSTQHTFGPAIVASVQLKGKLWETPWAGGLEWDGVVQYTDIRSHAKRRNTGRWHEWEIATCLAKSFGRLKPYAGVKYSLIRMYALLKDQGQVLKQTRYRDGAVGPMLGTDLYLGEDKQVIVNVEGSYLSGAPEVALSIAYTF